MEDIESVMRMVRFSGNNIIMRLIASTFVIVGIMFMIVSFVLSSNYSKDLKRCSAQVDATITDIITYIDSDNDKSHKTKISYSIDDKNYTTTLNHYNSKYKIGETLEINYNPDDPTDIVQKGNKFVYMIFRIMGIGFIIIGIHLRRVMLRIS